MTSATIDASLLAVPLESSGETGLTQYIASISEWRNIMCDGLLKAYIRKQTEELLSQIDRFPDFETLKKNIKNQHDSPYTVRDIHQVVTDLRSRSLCFEDEFGIRDLLTDKEEISPDVTENLDDDLKEQLLKNLVLLMVINRIGHGSDQPLIVGFQAPDSGTVHVKARKHDVEYVDGFLPEKIPHKLNGDVRLYSKSFALIRDVKAQDYFLQNQNEEGMIRALRIKISQAYLQRGENPDLNQPSYNPLGKGFIESVNLYMKAGKDLEKLLKTMVETFERIAVGKSHWLRTGKSGGSPQRVRDKDGAGAWRRKVDQVSRLHYWQCPAGRIEFANVTTEHNDDTIIF